MLRRLRDALVGGAAAAVDRAATIAAQASTARARKRNRAESLPHAERMTGLRALCDFYEHAVDAATYFRPPRDIAPTERRVRSLEGGAVFDLRWPSEHAALTRELGERWARGVENRSAAARLWLHREPRTVALLVHGYLSGAYNVEERMWPARWLFTRLGLDVGFFVLPYHGVRAIGGRRGPPPFPSSDPRLTHEGFRQAIGDLRDLVGWLRGRGHPAVGAMGMSLGGYTSALGATLEPSLAFAVLLVPLASLADFAREQGRLGTTDAEAAAEQAWLERSYALVSPLARPPLLPPERVIVLAGKGDRITPLSHAERLARHFRAPLEIFAGGHLLQLGRAAGFRSTAKMLARLGLLARSG
jgi:dienelactone hydrolase